MIILELTVTDPAREQNLLADGVTEPIMVEGEQDESEP